MPELYNSQLPELPWQKRERFDREYGVKGEDREMYITDIKIGEFFESAVKAAGDVKLAALASNYITSDLAGLIKNNPDLDAFARISPETFAELITMAAAGKISSRGTKDILAVMFREGGNPMKIAEERGLLQKSDEGELKAIVEKIIAENPQVAAEYKAGKEQSIQYLVGQGMKATKGSGNPEVLKKLLTEGLK
jgi:aspartyl-tRNA(Asn)/glutamyl-tRNA(Gln) amidotransferase subunit B